MLTVSNINQKKIIKQAHVFGVLDRPISMTCCYDVIDFIDCSTWELHTITRTVVQQSWPSLSLVRTLQWGNCLLILDHSRLSSLALEMFHK